MPRLVNGLEQVFTSLGIVGNGYKLFFFEYDSTTPKTTYSNEELSVENPNPVVCDSSGRPEFDVWGADPSTYKLVLGTPDSVIGNINPIKTLDPIDNNITPGSIISLFPIPMAYWGATTGTSSTYVLDPALVPITSYDDTQCFLLDFHTACSASPTININDIEQLDLFKYDIDGTTTDLEMGDVVGRHIAINNGAGIIILDPKKPYLDSRNFTGATESLKGVVELATNAETKTGTDTERSTTPAGMASIYTNSTKSVSAINAKLLMRETGTYSNLIIKVGKFISNNDGNIAVTFPEAFPTACLGVTDGGQDSSDTTAYTWSANAITTSGFNSNRTNGQSGTHTINYIAIGY